MAGKKGFLALGVLILVAVTTLSGCGSLVGEDGDVYQKYMWTPGFVTAIYDTNPSTPDTIYNDEYFRSQTGTFHMEYLLWDNTWWYGDYTIVANPGKTLIDGDDLWYVFYLYYSGPDLYYYDYAAAIAPDRSISPASTVAIAPVARDELTRGDILGTKVRDYGDYTVTLSYGRLIKK